MTPRPARGFTLIEVLVALTIVAVGMAAVMTAISSSANTVVYLRDKTFAQWVALNKIATLRISGQQPAQGDTEGDLDDFAGRSWHWRQQVIAAEGAQGIVRIEVSVRPKDAPGDKDTGWLTTAIGLYGNAVGTPDGGVTPNWGSQQPAQLVPNPTGAAPAATNPGATTTTTTTTTTTPGAVTTTPPQGSTQ